MGGLIRDVVCGERPLILEREVYATAAALGAAITVGMLAMGSPGTAAEAAGIAAALVLRGAAIQVGLKIPVYKARPGRPGRPPPAR